MRKALLKSLLPRGSFVLALAIGMWLSFPAGATTVASAAAKSALPLKSLALPASLFPRGSRVYGSTAAASTQQSTSRLHTYSFTKLGYVEGYAETADWAISQSNQVQLTYLASIFQSSRAAQKAYGDAQISLWEVGHPLAPVIGRQRLISVTTRRGGSDVFVSFYRGPIELELRLHYAPGLTHSALAWILWIFGRAASSSVVKAAALEKTIPASPASPNPSSIPAIYTAPWGTGPVVKSPSLMTLDASQLSPGNDVAPGSFRTRQAPVESSAVPSARFYSSNLLLARYVETAHESAGSGWYDSAALYPTPQSAENAFRAIAHANRARSFVRGYPLNPDVWHVGPFALLDESRAWLVGSESVFVVRLQNVVMTLAGTGFAPNRMSILLGPAIGSVPTYLHAQGTTIASAGGDPFTLKSINWYGAEENDYVVGGLDYQPYRKILNEVKLSGFNSIRVPYSNEMVETNPLISSHVAANPELNNLHALDLLDRIINYAGALGLSVIVDDHRSTAGWSTQPDGLWYAPGYPESSFQNDWVMLAQRYSVNNVVIGADLRNEPHAKVSWGDGNAQTDWHAAAQRVGDAVLGVNPHLLVIVEGIQFCKNAPSYWWGGSLQGVADDPVDLHFADGSSARSQLVYSVHDYGPDACGTGCPWFNSSTSYASLSQTWEQYWGFITADPTASYAAPVWVGEFGTCDNSTSCVQSSVPGSQGQWFSSLVQYIALKNLGWGYWSVNGTQSTATNRTYGKPDWYGLLDRKWAAAYTPLQEALRPLLDASQSVPGTT